MRQLPGYGQALSLRCPQALARAAADKACMTIHGPQTEHARFCRIERVIGVVRQGSGLEAQQARNLILCDGHGTDMLTLAAQITLALTAAHGGTLTSCQARSMVRRRSTVRFRKGAPHTSRSGYSFRPAGGASKIT
jgi:hypothetical protein